ncbi:unnamed protein product [Mycena citricolor]|uniref:Glucose-methanol-choline oxidoreductase N-terminal domain-containing protein n=1 Tax=Mycena citricolor TaxID=2018698 RepID=A0AAD2Q327_9AGAR|nr:unnamed protein product [Mycena citricolor]
MPNRCTTSGCPGRVWSPANQVLRACGANLLRLRSIGQISLSQATMPLIAPQQIGNKSFDYVIIGGGTSGLTLAARLSEDPALSVLVIEAGSANLDDPALLLPWNMGSQLGNPDYDWVFSTKGQESLGGRPVSFNRGKGLGGSSAINFYAFHLPHRSDVDAFEKLGNIGWNWDMLRQYYKRAEGFIEPATKTEDVSFDIGSHGTSGPVPVTYPTTMLGIEALFYETLHNLGHDFTPEPFSGDTTGTWFTPVSVDPRTGKRAYAANAYYQPNAERTNLSVVVSSHATKIASDSAPGSEFEADRVEFSSEGTLYSVRVEKDVVIAAGAIMSPQILELSGIGNPNIIAAAGLDVLVNLPGVGENVQEHYYTGISREVRDDIDHAKYTTLDVLTDPATLQAEVEQYERNGTGILGYSGSCMAFTSLSSIDDSGTLKHPTFETQTSPALRKQYKIQIEQLALGRPTCEFTLLPRLFSFPNPAKAGKQYLTCAGMFNHPFSRGTIHIKNANALERPEIDPRFFEDLFDLDVFVTQLKFCRRVLESDPLKGILGEEINPGPGVVTDDQLAEWAKSVFGSTFHTIGSCSMLPREDGGVVDTNLKVAALIHLCCKISIDVLSQVYGTRNVRVVDLSIIPLHIGAHTQSTAYAIGELAADIVLGKIVF